jgi:hypothetical protein
VETPSIERPTTPSSGSGSRQWSSGNEQQQEFIDVLDPGKAEELDEALFSIDGLRDRWEKVKNFEVIGEALMSGNLSLALSYLRWRSKQFGDTTNSNISLPDVRQIAYSLIYQTVSKNQVRRVSSLSNLYKSDMFVVSLG